MIESIIFFALIFIIGINSENCSTYDPCGTYGYCKYDSNGNLTCICKFWWTGTFCNQQSSTGIQVIIVGIVLGILIAIFHGFSIFYCIQKKKQQQENQTIRANQNIFPSPAWKHMTFTDVKRSARFSSCIIASLMLVITVLGLILKWLLVQPIHNELVNKYNRGDLLFYRRNSICNILDFEDFNMLTFPIACVFLLTFIVSSKRTSCMKNKLKGHVALVLPIDFYIHVKRKFAAVVFAIIADELLRIVSQLISGSGSTSNGIIVAYLLQILEVLFIGFRYYPTLASAHIDSIFSLACGTFYVWFNFIITIVGQSLCRSDFYPSDNKYNQTQGSYMIRLFEYYGAGQNLIIIQLFTDIPRFICWSYLVIKLPVLLINKIYIRIKHKSDNQSECFDLTREEKILLNSSFSHSVEMSYVRNLFRSPELRSTSRLFLARLIPKFIYQWRDDFRFSSRILCIYSSTFLLLFFMTVQSCILFLPSLDELQSILQTLIDAITSVFQGEDRQSEFLFPNLVRSFVIAILTACVITIIQLLVLLANIRRNLFQIFRGDDSEIPKRNKGKYTDYSIGNCHFAGYFIGYLTWGYVLIWLVTCIIYITLDACIVHGSVKLIEKLLKLIIPILLLIFLKQYINKILARFVFLQEYGNVLAINNRRTLMIFLYFNFFLDAFLGLVSSIVRIAQSIFGGIFYMCRLDYSPMGRKLETFDAGFQAYCGFIHMEAVHRNPIMLTFASYLYNCIRAKQYAAKHMMVTIKNNRIRKDYPSKVIKKWYLTMVLLRNPSLVSLRKHHLDQLKDKKNRILNNNNRKQSSMEQSFRRTSLVSDIDLRNVWHQNNN